MIQIQLIYLIILLLQLINQSIQLQIPLTYAFSSDMVNKYPIQLSFNTSQTITPYPMDTLYLYNSNISLNTIISPYSYSSQQQKVIIGLLYPSQFLQAISSHFKISLNQIEINKQDYLKLILNDLSFIQSQDIFVNKEYYNIKVQYNYGEEIIIEHQQIQLTDGDNILWNQFLIRKIVNNIKQENNIKIKYNNNNDTIKINGQIDNFPRITIVSGTYLFKVDMEKLLKKKPQLMYINTNTNTTNNTTNNNNNMNNYNYNNYINNNPKPTKQPTRIGIQLLTQFSKFQIQQQKIIFKRTSQLFMLYLFLTYFVIICLLIIIKNRQDNFKTNMFVKSIIKWVISEDYQARIEVLRTQLE